MSELISKKNFNLFTFGMEELQKRGNSIPEGQEKNRQFLKDQVLREMKHLFQSVDKNNPEEITTAALKLANLSFAVALGCGNMETYVNKILKLGTLTD